MIIDLHVHSSISPCSRLELPEILSHARSRGLDGVCVTDHDTMEARNIVQEGVQADGLLLVIGMEYATSQGDFLLFGPFEDLEPGLPAVEMLQLVHNLGGAAVAAHPCRKARPADPMIAAGGLLHAVERVNGRNAPLANACAQQWERGVLSHALPGTAGSDAHTLQELGRAPTRFLEPVRSKGELVEALCKGLCAPAVQALLPEFHHPRQHNGFWYFPGGCGAVPRR